MAQPATVETTSTSPTRARTRASAPGLSDLEAPLPRAAGDNAELADELLLIELQLLKAMRAKRPVVVPAISGEAKDKIIRCLKAKQEATQVRPAPRVARR